MDNITFKQLRNITEDQAREMLEAIRWNGTPVCPRLPKRRAHKLTPKGERKQIREGVYSAGNCRKQFTVTVGTIFEGSRIKIADWLMAIYLMCSSKKGSLLTNYTALWVSHIKPLGLWLTVYASQ